MRKNTKHRDPDPELVRRVLDYVPETGELKWRSNGRPVKGYSTLKLGRKYSVYMDGRQVLAHRLIFIWMLGYAPQWPLVIDHINRNGSDNRWANLREATLGENRINSKDQTEYRNIVKWNDNLYDVIIKRGGKRLIKATCNSLDLAISVRDFVLATLEDTK